jgi:hypothetical protein
MAARNSFVRGLSKQPISIKIGSVVSDEMYHDVSTEL